jgi:hypothetical protein
LLASVPLRVSASSLAWSRARLASSIGGIVRRGVWARAVQFVVAPHAENTTSLCWS